MNMNIKWTSVGIVMLHNERKRILQPALNALRRNLPQGAEVDIVKQPGPPERGAEALLRVVIDEKVGHFQLAIKTTVTKADIGLLLIQRENLRYPILLVTRYIPREKGEMLRREKLQFIDTAGNAYVDLPPLFIFVQGKKRPADTTRTMIGRAFHTKGLKVIYAFLCDHGLAGKPYRNIADTAGVALGTVGWLMKELKELGYLLDMGKKGCRLIRTEELLNRWVTAYPEKLRPKILVGYFEGDPGWWQGRILDPDFGLWGGEIAAARLTGDMKPQVITVYAAPLKINSLLLECRLRKNRNGDIQVYERFWEPMKPYMERYADLVHPILIYADLVATADPRNIETAKRIYEQHIIRLIGEN